MLFCDLATSELTIIKSFVCITKAKQQTIHTDINPEKRHSHL